MTTNFPTGLDTLSTTRGANNNPLNAPNHVTHHTNEDDAITALEVKVGVDGSAVTTTLDYKLSGVTTGDKAVSKTGTETMTNKTLASPKITAGSMTMGDLFQLSAADGTLVPLRATSDANIISWNAATSQWQAIPNPSASNASLTVKGVGQESTQALTDAGTELGSTGAINIITPLQLRARLINTGVVDTGSAGAYAIAPLPAITAYASYQEFTFKAVNTNTTTATLNVSGLGAKNIFNRGAACVGGEIVSGQIYTVVYDGTQFDLIGGSSNRALVPAILNTSRNSGTGSGLETIAHGLGRLPSSLQAFVSGTSAATASIGAYNGTTSNSILAFGGSSSSMDTSNVITIGGSNGYTATFTYDVTNVYITWTKSGSGVSLIALFIVT